MYLYINIHADCRHRYVSFVVLTNSCTQFIIIYIYISHCRCVYMEWTDSIHQIFFENLHLLQFSDSHQQLYFLKAYIYIHMFMIFIHVYLYYFYSRRTYIYIYIFIQQHIDAHMFYTHNIYIYVYSWIIIRNIHFLIFIAIHVPRLPSFIPALWSQDWGRQIDQTLEENFLSTFFMNYQITIIRVRYNVEYANLTL